MKNKKIDIINEILKHKIIAIVRGVEKEKLIPLAEAMYDGAVRFLEITYSADGSVSNAETAERIKLLCEHFEGRMLIGAGTVLDIEQVELTKKAGGSFIISPDAYDEVIKKTNELEMVSIPGVYTPSEIRGAVRAGADFVKLFPATQLGPDYIKAIKAPLSNIRLLAVGGVNPENMSDFEKAGACGFGIGSNIIDRKALDEEDYERITELARKYTSQIGVRG